MTSEAQDLTAALRAIPGVADAEVAPEAAEGVRVRLASDADPTDVAAAVRDVLAGRGLKGRMAPPQARIEPAGPPPPPVEISGRPGPRLVQATIEPAAPEPAPEPDTVPPEAIPQEPDAPLPDQAGTIRVELDRVEEIIREPHAAAVAVTADPIPPAFPDPEAGLSDAVPEAGTARPLLARVRVQEDRGGVAVTVDTDSGLSITRRGRPSDDGVREAVVAAVGALSGDQPPPVLVDVSEHDLGGHPVITVVVQRHDGTFHVGSAMIGAQKAFALARATWAAMGSIGR